MTTTLLGALRDHLVGQGVVRLPRDPGSAHPLFLEPREGAPGPGDGTGTEQDTEAVLSAFFTGGVPARPYESFLRTDTVDVWIRAVTAPVALGIADELRDALIDRRDFDMGGLRIVDCEEWRAVQRVGSDPRSFSFLASFLFQRYAHP